MTHRTRQILASLAAFSLLAGPSFADGRKGRPAFVARPVPALRIPEPAPLPP